MKRDELVGKIFGRWTVLAAAHKPSYMLCSCSCGQLKLVFSGNLLNGDSQSCGCVRKGNPTHRMYRTPTHNSWASMIQRCMNPKATSYPRYGARGISVCSRWLSSFENFLKDMGERPAGKTLDRIDPEGHYFPGNCRWADLSIQRKNQRSYSKNRENSYV